MAGDNAVTVVRAVLSVLLRHVRRGEMQHIQEALPRAFDLRWPPSREEDVEQTSDAALRTRQRGAQAAPRDR